MSKPSFFDLLEPGMRLELGSHTFTAEDITKYATKYDPQRFHLSEELAQGTLFGRHCASGWHTASAWMRLNVDNGRSQILQVTGYEGPEPVFGPSPGVRNIKWILPVLVGDTITYSSTVTDKRVSPKRPGWGMVMNHSEGFNQHGKLVISLDGSVTLRID